jgi:hypothetical protein
MIVAEILMGLGLAFVIWHVGKACFKLGRITKKEPK